jgi:hypothetical protein
VRSLDFKPQSQGREKNMITSVGENVDEQELLFISGGSEKKMCSCLGKQSSSSQKVIHSVTL